MKFWWKRWERFEDEKQQKHEKSAYTNQYVLKKFTKWKENKKMKNTTKIGWKDVEKMMKEHHMTKYRL
jgi:hypothetical protein